MVEKCLKNIPATGLYFAIYRLWSPQLAKLASKAVHKTEFLGRGF